MARAPRRARPLLLGLAATALAFTFAACSGGVTASDIPTELPSIEIPTFPPDDMASGDAACIDPETMAIIDQLRAPDADVEAILTANRDALVDGLMAVETSDPTFEDWRDSLVGALEGGDLTAAAAQVSLLAAGAVTLTPC